MKSIGKRWEKKYRGEKKEDQGVEGKTKFFLIFISSSLELVTGENNTLQFLYTDFINPDVDIGFKAGARSRYFRFVNVSSKRQTRRARVFHCKPTST